MCFYVYFFLPVGQKHLLGGLVPLKHQLHCARDTNKQGNEWTSLRNPSTKSARYGSFKGARPMSVTQVRTKDLLPQWHLEWYGTIKQQLSHLFFSVPLHRYWRGRVSGGLGFSFWVRQTVALSEVRSEPQRKCTSRVGCSCSHETLQRL